jgi:hypothetical protein
MDEVWCSLDSMPADIAAGIHQPPPPDLHDPSFWPAFAEYVPSRCRLLVFVFRTSDV